MLEMNLYLTLSPETEIVQGLKGSKDMSDRKYTLIEIPTGENWREELSSDYLFLLEKDAPPKIVPHRRTLEQRSRESLDFQRKLKSASLSF